MVSLLQLTRKRATVIYKTVYHTNYVLMNVILGVEANLRNRLFVSAIVNVGRMTT